MKHAIITLFL